MNKHAASGYSLFTHCSFDTTKKKHYLSGEDCRKNFCKDLRVHATEIINYEKKKGNFVIIMTMTKSITVIKLENIEVLHIICII